MLDDLSELRTFRAILAAGSLSAVARDSGTTVGVVSKRLASLEKRAGVRLVHRTTRSLSPTEAGQRLLIEVESALEALAAAEEQLANGRDHPTGLLKVTAPVSFGRRFVVPVLGRLAEQHPRLVMALELHDRLVDLVAESVDVAIRIGEPVDSSAMMRKLLDNRRILVASPAYLDRIGRPNSPADTAHHAFLRYGAANAPWRLFGTKGQTASLAAKPTLRVDNGDALRDWALAGRGIMFKSEIDIRDDLAAGALERVLPGWDGGSTPVIALYPSAHHLSLKTRLFLDAISESVASNPGR